jgi:hypothetical protein
VVVAFEETASSLSELDIMRVARSRVKMQAEIELATIKAGLDTKIALFDAPTALDLAASAARHDMKTRQPNNEEETDV